jgi:hypothetical protein
MIQPPGWAKHAVPKSNGWHDPRTNELLKSARISEREINEYFGNDAPEPQVLVEVPVSAPAPMIDESPMASDDLDTMTKMELEALGREHGIELDRRKSKAVLITELRNHMLG